MVSNARAAGSRRPGAEVGTCLRFAWPGSRAPNSPRPARSTRAWARCRYGCLFAGGCGLQEGPGSIWGLTELKVVGSFPRSLLPAQPHLLVGKWPLRAHEAELKGAPPPRPAGLAAGSNLAERTPGKPRESGVRRLGRGGGAGKKPATRVRASACRVLSALSCH